MDVTYIKQMGSCMTNKEQFSLEYVESHDKHSCILRFVFIGLTPPVASVNASGLVGDAKRLRLLRFDGL